MLVLSNGELVTVEWVQHELLESPVKVYNFEVEDYHTYFVGENGVFVHNGCEDSSLLTDSSENQTLISGEEWYRYFQDEYGVENVSWDVHSFDDILNHPTSLRNYDSQEIAEILGDNWRRDTYGSNGSGWKFIENGHDENMVFYHGGGGEHGGSYWGASSGKTGKMKVVDDATYIPKPRDHATIIYRKDW